LPLCALPHHSGASRRFPEPPDASPPAIDQLNRQEEPMAEKKARGGLAKPVTPSADLAKIVGGGSMTRADVTKKVWDYIKANKLQDQKNKRQINADDKLRPIFGGKAQVSMFEMTKLVNNHLKG
jgi:chromatin remodeling complex protein RSC6